MTDPDKLISIITIVRNDPDGLERTIQSVVGQSYKTYEYIVVDGASTDSTAQVIERHKRHISKLISGPDRGIYDAMNKGVNVANGEYVIFMNAGDSFNSDNVLEAFIGPLNDDVDIFYGDAYFEPKEEGSRPLLWKAQTNQGEFWKKMPFSHQSAFVKRTLLMKYPFSLSNKIVSDFEFFIRAQKDGATFRYVDVPVVLIERGGLSHQSILRRTWERYRVVNKHYHSMRKSVFYIKLLTGILLGEIRRKETK